MAILSNGLTVTGLPGPMTSGEYSKINFARDTVGNIEGLVLGGTVTPSGTLAATVSAFTAYAVGVRVDSSAPITVNFAANTGATRIDLVVVEINWSGTGSARVFVVPGTPGGTVPNLTANRNPGVLWQMPIAKVTVRTNATAIASADMVSAAPRRRTPLSQYQGITLGQTLAANGTPLTLATISLADPGWPYILDLRGETDVNTTFNGNKGEVALRVAGVEVVSRFTPELSTLSSGSYVSHLTPGTMTGDTSVVFVLKPFSIVSGTISPTRGRLYAMQIPA